MATDNHLPSPFAANTAAQIGRMPEGIQGIQPESDNDDSVPFASPSVVVIPSDELLAASDELIRARFWSHVDKHGPVHPVLGTRCWLWTANVVGHGNKHHHARSQHGQFTYRLFRGAPQRHVYAHRFAWVMARGPIPHGLNILHHCDVPPCVRNDHHFVGTQADNMQDAAKKQRFTVPRTRTLSLHDRLTIYHAPQFRGADVALARTYGVSKACISVIRRGRFLGSGVWSGTKYQHELAEAP